MLRLADLPSLVLIVLLGAAMTAPDDGSAASDPPAAATPAADVPADDAAPAREPELDWIEECDDALELLDALHFYLAPSSRPVPRPDGLRVHRREQPRLSDAQLDCAIEVAGTIDPTLRVKLEHQRSADETAFEQAVRHHGRSLIVLCQLRERDEDLFDLKMRELRLDAVVNDLVERHRAALAEGNEAAAKRLRADVEREVRRQLALSIQARGEYLLRLKAYVKEVENELRDDAAGFNAAVTRRLDDLFDESGAGGERAAARR